MWKAELEEILEPIHRNPRVQMMKKFVQHGNTSTFEHCQSVLLFILFHGYDPTDPTAVTASIMPERLEITQSENLQWIERFSPPSTVTCGRSIHSGFLEAAKPGYYGLPIRSKHSGKCW